MKTFTATIIVRFAHAVNGQKQQKVRSRIVENWEIGPGSKKDGITRLFWQIIGKGRAGPENWDLWDRWGG